MKKLFFVIFLISLFLFIKCKDSYTTIEPDEQYIKIHMKYDFNNDVNTFENQLTKDLVLDGTVTTEFWFTIEEQFKIEEMTYLIEFFSYPDSILASLSDTGAAYSPNPGIQSLRIEHESNHKTVFWNYPVPSGEQTYHLLKLHDLIIEIIELKPEYLKLPDARGGYL